MTNQLASQASAYLKSAAHQPVDWLPWSEDAFRKAQVEKKPILLDIGAVWCHWCHVMDAESYDDPRIAEILNRDFVCVKVDRDEQPDVDTRYQRAVSALTGQGGWPLTAFLTPEGEVFFGGTYFPPGDGAQGRPGFLAVLRHVGQAFRQRTDEVRTNAEAISRHVAATLSEGTPGDVTAALVDAAAEQMARYFDARHGGFGSAPKFPHPGAVEFLLARWYDARLDWQHEIVIKTLDGMARGGIRDHVGGGFHRYAVDARWVVPHFEKMSYDNSELLRAYCSAFAAAGTPLYRAVARGIVDWVTAVLKNPDGRGFATSQDADVGPGDDGDYWTWTPDEIRTALDPPAATLIEDVYDVDQQGEMHHNPAKNVLWLRREPAPEERDTLARALRALKTARDGRPTPLVDRAAYVNWNAMMAGALLQAGAVLDLPDCNALALAVLEGMWGKAWDAGSGMSHRMDGRGSRGLLEDNVHAAAAFLDAYEATGASAWLERAVRVMRYCLTSHWDDPGGGFFDLAAGRGGPAYLATRAKPAQDAPTPSANGVAGLVLARLAALTDAAEWRERLEQLLRAFAGGAPELSLYGAALFRAMDWSLHPVTRIEVAGPAGAGAACAMHLLALQAYRPRKVVVRTIADEPRATVCVGTTCSLPVSTPDELARLLA